MKNWQLLRCIYDPMGMNLIEIEDPDGFKNFFAEDGYGEEGWFLGTVIKGRTNYLGNPYVRVEIEGKKKNLEKILELIHKEI